MSDEIIYFLKAHDPHNLLTLRDDKDNEKYTHKYTHTQIHKLEMLERPIMCYIYKSTGFKDIKYDIPM